MKCMSNFTEGIIVQVKQWNISAGIKHACFLVAENYLTQVEGDLIPDGFYNFTKEVFSNSNPNETISAHSICFPAIYKITVSRMIGI